MSLTGGRETRDRVVIVDSGSADWRSTERVCEEFRVEFFRIESNVGYGAANNRAALMAYTPWMVFVNPDVETTLDDLHRLVDCASDLGAVCAGPRVMSRAGKVSKPIVDEMGPRWRRSSFIPIRMAEGVLEVAAVSGCCLAVETAAFNSLGGFDERFFMFAEEIDLQRRLRAGGGVVVYLDSVMVLTEGGSSSEGVSSRWSLTERDVAHVRYVRKHFTWVEGSLDIVYRAGRMLFSRKYAPRLLSIRQLLAGVRRAR